ncbi:MAG: iron-containing redox enzyme family protein [Deltaproteobacteria bacterium]|nr:iron-containing redox enzyme family protein [Deltaproteobacteria bacterium]
MDIQGWRKAIGDMVRDHMASDTLTRYYSIRQTPLRAQVVIRELAHFVRHRRDCWAYVSGNCPEWSVKQKILQHEYGEVIKDEYSEHGHISLILKQGRSVGLGVDDILQAEPIPTTRATLYGWAWITREKPWLEGLAALTVTEWCNDDRLLMDQGGGNSTRMARRWIEDMGIKMKDMPNFEVHSQADEEHSDMFLPDLSSLATGALQERALQAVKESLELLTIYRAGIADAMERIPADD